MLHNNVHSEASMRHKFHTSGWGAERAVVCVDDPLDTAAARVVAAVDAGVFEGETDEDEDDEYEMLDPALDF